MRASCLACLDGIELLTLVRLCPEVGPGRAIRSLTYNFRTSENITLNNLKTITCERSGFLSQKVQGSCRKNFWFRVVVASVEKKHVEEDLKEEGITPENRP